MMIVIFAFKHDDHHAWSHGAGPMKLKGSVVFVTGANRGIGLALARQARDLGAKKVYGGMRNTAGFNEPGVVPVRSTSPTRRRSRAPSSRQATLRSSSTMPASA
jgi:hypothetical protein